MTPTELHEEVAVEVEALETTIRELVALQEAIADREPTVREKTAAAAFLAQFYNGVENILKRISSYYLSGITWPRGSSMWKPYSCRLKPGFSSPCERSIPRTISRKYVAGRQVPLGRMATPKDIANLAGSLAFEEARQITGQTVHVNGGQYLY